MAELTQDEQIAELQSLYDSRARAEKAEREADELRERAEAAMMSALKWAVRGHLSPDAAKSVAWDANYAFKKLMRGESLERPLQETLDRKGQG